MDNASNSVLPVLIFAKVKTVGIEVCYLFGSYVVHNSFFFINRRHISIIQLCNCSYILHVFIYDRNKRNVSLYMCCKRRKTIYNFDFAMFSIDLYKDRGFRSAIVCYRK